MKSQQATQLPQAVDDILRKIPFLRLPGRRIGTVPFLSDDEKGSGLHVGLEVAGASRTLILRELPLGQPRFIRSAALELKESVGSLPRGTVGYGIVVAPFVSEASAAVCREAGIGYVDHAGNAFISFDHIHVEIRVSDNPFREKREIRSVFAPKATRAIRFLLQGPLRPWKVVDLAEAAKISLGLASSIRRQLFDREWAKESDDGLRVTKPALILDAWAQADDWKKRTDVREYSLLLQDADEIALRVHGVLGKRRHAFTQWLGAALRHPYTTPPIVTVYVDEWPEDSVLKETLLARQVESGGRLRLVVPREDGVFNPIQTIGELPVVSDAQLYLDLLQAGLRGDEAATELRMWPDFSGGWAL